MPQPPPAPEPNPVVLGQVGCYLDNPSSPDLSASSFSAADMSRAKCELACVAINSPVYGLQGTTCFCGADQLYGKYGVADPSRCDIACAGNAADNCGGVNHNMIYSLAPPDGFDPCEDGGIDCVTSSITPQLPQPPQSSQPPNGQQTQPPNANTQPPVGPISDGVNGSSAWNGFGGLGLIISIVIIVLIVLVVAGIIGLTVWLVKRKPKSPVSKWEMY